MKKNMEWEHSMETIEECEFFNIPDVNNCVPLEGDDEATTAEHYSASQAHTVPILPVSCVHCFQSGFAEL